MMHTILYWFFTLSLGLFFGMLLLAFTETHSFKGWLGELKVRLLFLITLKRRDYVRFNRVIFERNGRTTEVDHLIISKYGIFVIETKDFDGYISGESDASFWTQRIGKEDFRFQNPLHQNYRHVCFVKEILGVDESRIKSVIIFASSFGYFKQPIAENVVYVSKAHRYVKSFVEPVFTDEEVKDFVLKIKGRKFCSRKKHIENVRHHVESVAPKCPKCCSEMKRKCNRKSGSHFWGCSKYPECKGSRKIKSV